MTLEETMTAKAKASPWTGKTRFEGSKGAECWLAPDDVETVTAIDTRYGPRLLCVMKDSGRSVWLADTPTARESLKLG